VNESTTFTCPLCSSGATVGATSNLGRYKALACTTCGEFVVSDTAANRLQGLPSEFMEQTQRTIRSANHDEILLIVVEPVGAGGGLKAELVPRSSLSL